MPGSRRPYSTRPFGSRFASDSPLSGTHMTNSQERSRILLVEDYDDAREMYSEYLTFSGFETVQAANGMEAIRQAVATNPHIVVMDLSLPEMDGWETTRRLKADARTADIPILALTGHVL